MVAGGNTFTRQGRVGQRSSRSGARARRHGAYPVLLVLALLCAQVPALAGEAIDIAVAVGFTDTFRPGRWTPLIVTVTNHGDDLSGELEVQVTGGSELRGRQFITSHRRKLELYRGSRKSLHFTVFPQSLFHPLVIRVRAGDRELKRAEIDLRARAVADERLLLVLSRDANLDYLNASGDNGLRVLYPHPELLPAHWRGYDAVAAVVVHGVSLERLSADQFEALSKWIAQGGILAVSGVAEYTLLRTPRLAALLPGLPEGMTRLPADDLKAAFKASPDLSRPVHVHRLGELRGRTRLSAGDVPLVVERTLGLGRVLYATFDVASPPFDRWQGMRELWMQALSLPPPRPISLNVVDSVLESPLAAMIRAQSADYASYVTVLLFLTLYLGLLIAGYQLSLRGLRPSLLSWAVPSLFALAAWLLFGPAMFPRGASALTVAVIEPLPKSSYARLELDLGVYANRSGPWRFEYRGAEPVLYPRQAQRGAQVGDWVLGEGPRPYVEAKEHRRYVLQALQGNDVIAFDLKATLYDEGIEARFVMDNGSGHALEALRLVYDHRLYELGSVAAGARIERRLSRQAPSSEPGKPSWRGLLKPIAGVSTEMLEPTRIILERKAQAAGENGYPGPGHALLIGYTQSPLRPAGDSVDWPRREHALVAVRITAESQDRSSGRGTVPRALQHARRDRVNLGSGRLLSAGVNIDGLRGD